MTPTLLHKLTLSTVHMCTCSRPSSCGNDNLGEFSGELADMLDAAEAEVVGNFEEILEEDVFVDANKETH